MKHIIISNGIAGTEAAVAIRKRRPDDTITIIASSKHLFYARPRLLEYLSGKATRDKITTYKKDFYEKNCIELQLGERATRIDPIAKTVSTTSGKTFEYDRLLLACGARPFMPAIPGSEKPGVFTLRGLTDADSIRNYCKPGDPVVIIGGGLLGLETAHNMGELGCRVTVIEFAERLLPRQLDTAGADLLQKQLENDGITFLLNDAVAEMEGHEHLEQIRLKSDRTLPVKAAIFSTGVRSRLELAQNIGIKTNQAIVVNDHMETSVQDIYAAGDAIEHRGRCYGLWMPARQQGQIAGSNMAGDPMLYHGTPSETRLKVAGISLFSAGEIHGEADTRVLISQTESTYRKLVLKENKIIGAIILGDNPLAMKVSKAFKGQAGLDAIPDTTPPFEEIEQGNT